MFFFPFIWYLSLLLFFFSIFFFSDTINTFGIYFSQREWFEYFWILPFYFLSEIIFICLNISGIQNDKNILNNLSIENKLETLQKTAVIIPCHFGYNELKKTIDSLTNIFQYVFISDNGCPKNQEFEEFCFLKGIFYHHYVEPNKTNAIFLTTKYIKNKYPFIQYIVLLDDDTIVNDNFFIRTDLLQEPTTAGYTCTIGIQNAHEKSILEKWIDFEYRTISFRNRSRNFHTLKFLHGIICIYKINHLLSIFQWNPCHIGGLPFGEDAFAGLTARQIGYQLKHDHLNIVYTHCPNQLFSFSFSRIQGYGSSSLFKQRVLRWYLSWPRRLFTEFGLLFIYDTGSWFGNILYRLDFIWYLWILSNACWWVFTLSLTTFKSIENIYWFFYFHFAFFILNGFTSYIRTYFMNHIESKNIPWYIPLTFPCFMFLLLFLYSTSFLISLFYYIPFKRINYKECYKNI